MVVAEKIPRVYRQRHSRFYISLAESILRSVSPAPPSNPSTSSYTFTPSQGAKFLKQYKTGFTNVGIGAMHANAAALKDLDVRTGINHIRRTMQTRRSRSFLALTEHNVFKSLAEPEQQSAGVVLAERLDEFYAAQCRARLGDGWEEAFEALSVMQPAGSRTNWLKEYESPVPLRGLLVVEEAERLLARLDREGDRSESWERLKRTLGEFIAERRVGEQSVIADGMQSLEDVTEKG